MGTRSLGKKTSRLFLGLTLSLATATASVATPLRRQSPTGTSNGIVTRLRGGQSIRSRHRRSPSKEPGSRTIDIYNNDNADNHEISSLSEGFHKDSRYDRSLPSPKVPTMMYDFDLDDDDQDNRKCHHARYSEILNEYTRRAVEQSLPSLDVNVPDSNEQGAPGRFVAEIPKSMPLSKLQTTHKPSRRPRLTLTSRLMMADFDSLFSNSAFRHLTGDTSVNKFMKVRKYGTLFKSLFSPSKLFADRVLRVALNLRQATHAAVLPDHSEIMNRAHDHATSLAALPLGPEILGVIGRAYAYAASVYMVNDWKSALWNRIKMHCNTVGKFCKLALTIVSSGTRKRLDRAAATDNIDCRDLDSPERERRNRQIDSKIAWSMYDWETTLCITRAVESALDDLSPGERASAAAIIHSIGSIFCQIGKKARPHPMTPLEVIERVCAF